MQREDKLEPRFVGNIFLPLTFGDGMSVCQLVSRTLSKEIQQLPKILLQLDSTIFHKLLILEKNHFHRVTG